MILDEIKKNFLLDSLEISFQSKFSLPQLSPPLTTQINNGKFSAYNFFLRGNSTKTNLERTRKKNRRERSLMNSTARNVNVPLICVFCF